MFVNSGYRNNTQWEDFETFSAEDLSKPLIVCSCGEYRLKHHPVFKTNRPTGRTDYQLLYVAAGKAHFLLGGRDEALTAGQMILYRPSEPQIYWYCAEDHPEVFWVHFTGSEVDSMLQHYRFSQSDSVFFAGALPDYKRIFRQMIQELQLSRPFCEDTLAFTLQQLFVLISRQQIQDGSAAAAMQPELDNAVAYFSEHYNHKIRIEEYAERLHLSTAWFIHVFKQHTGVTPMQYLLSLRISNSLGLLEQTGYTITEIAAKVGYDNPLYFSRLFKKQMGISPLQYRNRNH